MINLAASGFAQKIVESDVIVLDVRTAAEFNESHLSNSVNIDVLGDYFSADGRWKWEFTGSHVPLQPEIPISNPIGWLLAGMGLMAILNKLLHLDRRRVGTSTTVPDFFLMWNWFSGVVGNLFFFDRAGTALIGGLVFGLVLLPYVFLLRYGPPVNS